MLIITNSNFEIVILQEEMCKFVTENKKKRVSL